MFKAETKSCFCCDECIKEDVCKDIDKYKDKVRLINTEIYNEREWMRDDVRCLRFYKKPDVLSR
jgi:hypothetical protein